MDRALSFMVLCALVATVLLLALTLELLRRHIFRGGNNPAVMVLFQGPSVLLALWLRRQSTKRRELGFALRACAWIPILHLAILVGVQAIWSYVVRTRTDENSWVLDFGESVPGWTILFASAGFLLAALLWSSSRNAERRMLPWLHPLTIFLVVFLLVLGLWLPIACQRFPAFDHLLSLVSGNPVMLPSFPWLVLLPPTALATVTVLLSRIEVVQRLALVRGLRTVGLIVVGIALAAAIHARAGAGQTEALAYANFVPVMLCAAALCMICIATTALAYWQTLRQIQAVSSRPAPWRQEGTVASSPETGAPARVHYLGWLRGIEMETTSFVLGTKGGSIPIPRGSKLIAPVPLWTIGATRGASRAVLRRGDRVTASGFVEPTTEQAYRSSSVPVVGSDGVVVVMSPMQPWNIWREITLISWRPTLLYLAAGAIVAVPGLVGFFVW